MKLIKNRGKNKYLESEPFNFQPINDINNFDIFTSYINGQSPEFESDMDKLFMVLEGNVQLTVDKKSRKMKTGDILLLNSGEKFQFKAADGAKMLQFTNPLTTSESEKIMEFACSRHSTRKFLDKPILKKDIYYILKIGMHAPSGANRQPWKFVIVNDAEVKRNIRERAEKIEKKYYEKHKNTDLIRELNKMGLTWKKPFLENAPILICIFGDQNQLFYKESLWLSVGWMLLAAEELGISTLTYKPDEMGFLNRLLKVHEPYLPELIIPMGYAAESITPKVRKDLFELVTWI